MPLNMVKQLYLHCCVNSHKPIFLPDGIPIKVGRSPETGIQVPKVARHQVELTADYDHEIVAVHQLGINACEIDDSKLKKGMLSVLKLGSILNMVKKEFPHIIKLSDEIIAQKNEKIKKRSLDLSSQNCAKKSRVENHELCSSDEETESVKRQLQLMKQKCKNGSDYAEKQSPPLKPTHQRNLVTDDIERCNVEKWEIPQKNLIVHWSKGVISRPKIAGFDIDHTIICTQSGKKFPTDTKDWKIMLNEIPPKLKKLDTEGYKIVFFTNQNGIAKKRVSVPDFKIKIQEIIEKLGLPVQVLISSGPGSFRKPGFGMWNYLENYMNDGIEIDKEKSFYVGDAAGRQDKWAPGKKKDFACSDRLFALNVGIDFYTPEEYFLGYRKADFKMPEFDPRTFKSDAPLSKTTSDRLWSSECEVVVCVGFPASGKSFFSKNYLVPKGYVHVNRDILGTWQKCVMLCEDSLKMHKKIVIDNTNPDVDSRKRYIDLCKQYKVPCRCFFFDLTFQHVRHNERFREMTDTSHQPINEMILNSFKSKFVSPAVSEGFSELIKINFVPKFKSKELETIYRCFLLEK